ncbi:hypothetical protein [Anaeroselena agilis]|uniref:Uncharacterized protein n=1 Tax=Anaeroselena agilis TaxID=3063788 RepID=A0ABU3NVJ9_9FIRM|nr:hypothetical protein [Selenomonadales bacterium 4137-cl]
MGEAFAIKNISDVTMALQAANEAKKLADPQIELSKSGLARDVMATGGGAGRQENPNFAAIKQVGSGKDAPRFDFVPFQDWFSTPRRRR